jgi:hypothetical protein
MIVGGDVLLDVQGISVATKAGMVQALKTLETLPPGQEMRATVLRAGRVVDLRTRGRVRSGWSKPERAIGDRAVRRFMQAVGMVNDHTVDCFRWRGIQQIAARARKA